MVEDALGLKLYQHKKAESERKLEETGNNIEKTKSLRREIGPHLTFLRIQVEKIEKARELKEALAAKLSEYLARENAWITQEDARLKEEVQSLDEELRDISAKLQEARSKRTHGGSGTLSELQSKIVQCEAKLTDARGRSGEIARELGRAEGALERNDVMVEQIVTVPHVRGFARELDSAIEEIERNDDLQQVRNILAHLRIRIRSFVDGLTGAAPVTNAEAKREVDDLNTKLERVQAEQNRITSEIDGLRSKMAETREEGFAAERDIVGLEATHREVESKKNAFNAARATVATLRLRFEEEVREGIALIGAAVHAWDKNEIPPGALSEDRSNQEKRRRETERLKIKIEESGIGNGDAVVREFKQTKERDEFLARELEDLEKSAASLKEIIAELEKTIDIRFTEGLKQINVALHDFFQKLFGGGEAKLRIEEPHRPSRQGLDVEDGDEEDEMVEEEELYAGLSISVSLPRKKIRGLEVLSGGERALTSIALIFSMTQVNPPPFLILDETDAALDEANSKRYADMIKELGQKSQLIVITHNRATMAAAGELYGVTMGHDGVSKLLSVKLEEAERVAK